ncbi:MAG: leucyl/phenylalanyl-tRNA--protein transferase [Actinomycetales bacterium]|nr:leucyl/phenylalanyl-tRNA--protein transferase [Dietzia sp.]NLX00254.1 leucyl/phenylalanyl-tRNA--protein transferase [Actinomycetales bacterium]
MNLAITGPQWPPIEPPPSRWRFDLRHARPGEDLLTAGGDLWPGTLLAAYRAGAFPMGVGRHGGPPIGWWSPDPRGVLLPGGMHVSRSLARSARRFEIRVNTAFDEVIAACADPRRDGRWITEDVVEAYRQLHLLGWVHSIEAWRDGRLAGGLYGVMIGGLFAGESMFHRESDASKVALLGLVERFLHGGRIIDVQWQTPHLASLGVIAIPREEYLERLARALTLPAEPL